MALEVCYEEKEGTFIRFTWPVGASFPEIPAKVVTFQASSLELDVILAALKNKPLLSMDKLSEEVFAVLSGNFLINREKYPTLRAIYDDFVGKVDIKELGRVLFKQGQKIELIKQIRSRLSLGFWEAKMMADGIWALETLREQQEKAEPRRENTYRVTYKSSSGNDVLSSVLIKAYSDAEAKDQFWAREWTFRPLQIVDVTLA